jgi:glycerophosphoryl diester phosphodiesterase
VRELDYWLGQPISQITSDRPDLALQMRTARHG